MCSSKLGVILTNGVLLVLSLVMLMVGAVIQSSVNENYRLFTAYASLPSTLTLAFGVVLSLTALLALISVYCRNDSLLSVHIYTLTLLMIIELAVGISGFAVKPRVLDTITDSLRSAESKYTSDNLSHSSWNSFQQDLKCCGLYRYDEWFHVLGNSSLPDSCCISYGVGCGRDALSSDNFYQTGCASAISRWANRHEISFAVLLPLMLILQFFALVCSRSYIRVLNIFNSFEN